MLVHFRVKTRLFPSGSAIHRSKTELWHVWSLLAERRTDGRLEPCFHTSHGKARVDDRRVLSRIIFINRNGLRWREAPREYGPHKTLYNRWKRWSNKSIFAQMMVGLAANHGEEKTVMIDATYLKAHWTATSMGVKRRAWTPNRSEPKAAWTPSHTPSATVRAAHWNCSLLLAKSATTSEHGHCWAVFQTSTGRLGIVVMTLTGSKKLLKKLGYAPASWVARSARKPEVVQ